MYSYTYMYMYMLWHSSHLCKFTVSVPLYLLLKLPCFSLLLFPYPPHFTHKLYRFSKYVYVSSGDNGSLLFWDWKTGYNFQKHQTTVQPGSLDSEAGIFKCVFDMSGCRLLTAEADKTIKIYKEDEAAVG